MKMIEIMTSDLETIELDVDATNPATREALKVTSDRIDVTQESLQMTSDHDAKLLGIAQGAMPRLYEMNRVLRETLITTATPSLFMKEYH